MLHVCIELWVWDDPSLGFSLWRKPPKKNSGTEKKQLLCARTKLDKMLVVIFSVVFALFFFILLSDVLRPAYQDLKEFAIRS